MRTTQPLLYAFLFFIFVQTTHAKELTYKDQGQLHDIQQLIATKRIEQDIFVNWLVLALVTRCPKLNLTLAE